jgi:hypothetical protein
MGDPAVSIQGLLYKMPRPRCMMSAALRVGRKDSEGTYSMNTGPIDVISKDPKLFNGYFGALVCTTIDIGKAPAMRGISDRNADSTDEKRCRKDVRISAEFDQQVESMTIEIIVEFEFI